MGREGFEPSTSAVLTVHALDVRAASLNRAGLPAHAGELPAFLSPIYVLDVCETTLRQHPTEVLEVNHDYLPKAVVVQRCSWMIQRHNPQTPSQKQPSVQMPDRVLLQAESFEDL